MLTSGISYACFRRASFFFFSFGFVYSCVLKLPLPVLPTASAKRRLNRVDRSTASRGLPALTAPQPMAAAATTRNTHRHTIISHRRFDSSRVEVWPGIAPVGAAATQQNQSSSFFSKSCEQRTHEAPTPQPTPIDVTRLRPWPVPGGGGRVRGLVGVIRKRGDWMEGRPAGLIQTMQYI